MACAVQQVFGEPFSVRDFAEAAAPKAKAVGFRVGLAPPTSAACFAGAARWRIALFRS
jgi:hypothetical protein